MKNKVLKKALVKFKSLTRRRLLLYLTILILLSFISYVFYLSYLYIDYNFVQKEKIELYLDNTSKELVDNSANDTELIENIVQWEREYYRSPTTNSFDTFDSLHEIPLRRTPPDPLWSLYLKKASCGEFACVFEEMANRTGLTSRSVFTVGFLNPHKMNGNNHGWSEVQLDNGDWVIGDAGFGLAPPEDNQSFFYSQRNLLLGPIYFVENDTYVDNMELYVPNTQQVTIHATKRGEDFTGGLLYVLLHYNGTSRRMWLPHQTNESGLAEVNLGVYDGVTYTIGVMDPVTTDYVEDEILSSHGSNVESITLDEWKFSKIVINGVLLVLWCIVYIGIMISDTPSKFAKMGEKVGEKLTENKHVYQQIQRWFRKKH